MAHFDPGSVIWELNSRDKFDAIREIIYQAPVFTAHGGFDLGEFTDAVITREKVQSTGLGHGVAIAHGPTDKVDSPHIALGVSREGIDFDSADGKPVHLLFVVANHPGRQMDYLQILSTLVSMVRNELFRRELLGCRHLAELQQLLCDAFHQQLQQNRFRRAC